MKLNVGLLFLLVFFTASSSAQQPVSLEMNCIDISNSTKQVYVCQWTPFNSTVSPKYNNYSITSTSCPIGFQLMRLVGSIAFSDCPGGSTKHIWISNRSTIVTKLNLQNLFNIIKVNGSNISFNYVTEMIQFKYFLCSSSIRKDYQYMGCYIDNQFARDLNGYTILLQKSNSLSECIDACKLEGFIYCGIQYSNECYCGNSYGRYSSSTTCTTPCIAPYMTESCGADIFTIPCASSQITAKPAVHDPTTVSSDQTTRETISTRFQSTHETKRLTGYITLTRNQQTSSITQIGPKYFHDLSTTGQMTHGQTTFPTSIANQNALNRTQKTITLDNGMITLKQQEMSIFTTLKKLSTVKKQTSLAKTVISGITSEQNDLSSVTVTLRPTQTSRYKSTVKTTQATSITNKPTVKPTYSTKLLESTSVQISTKPGIPKYATTTTLVPHQVGQWALWATSKCTLIKRRRNLKNPELLEIIEEPVTNLQLCDNLDSFYRYAVLDKQTVKMLKEVKEVKFKLNKTKEILSLKYAAQQSVKNSFGWLAVVVVITMFTLVVLVDVTKMKNFKKLKSIFAKRSNNKKRKPKMPIKSNVYRMTEFNPRRALKNVDLERQIFRQIRRMRH